MKNKKLLKAIILILCIAIFSVACFFILKALGITDIAKLQQIINKTGEWAIVVFILVRVALTIFLCFVPACSMIFDLLAVALFGVNIKCFIICMISIAICSTVMYLLGLFGASKIMEKLIGEEDLEKANKLIKEKGIVFYPLMMACGGFPDDALVCVAGTIKMNFVFWLLSTVLGRSIGCATTIFGLSLIPFASFTTFYDWFVFACCIIVLAFVIIKGGNWINNYVKRKN